MSALLAQLRKALVMARPVLLKADQDGMFYPDAGHALREVDAAILIVDHGLEPVGVLNPRQKFDWYTAWAGFGMGVILTALMWGLLFQEVCK